MLANCMLCEIVLYNVESVTCIADSLVVIDNELMSLNFSFKTHAVLKDECKFQHLELVVAGKVFAALIAQRQQQFQFDLDGPITDPVNPYFVLEAGNKTEMEFINSVIIEHRDFNHCFRSAQILNIRPTYEQCFYMVPTNCTLPFEFKRYLQIIKSDVIKDVIVTDTEARWQNFQEGDRYFELEDYLTPEQKSEIYNYNMVDLYKESRFYCFSCATEEPEQIEQCRHTFMQAYYERNRYLSFNITGDDFNVSLPFRNINAQLSCVDYDFSFTRAQLSRNQIWLRTERNEKFLSNRTYWIQIEIHSERGVNTSWPLGDIFDTLNASNTCAGFEFDWHVSAIYRNNYFELPDDVLARLEEKNCTNEFLYMSVDLTDVEIDERATLKNVMHHCFNIMHLEVFDAYTPRIMLAREKYCIIGALSELRGNVHIQTLQSGTIGLIATLPLDFKRNASIQCFKSFISEQQLAALSDIYLRDSSKELLIAVTTIHEHRVALFGVMFAIGTEKYAFVYPLSVLLAAALYYVTGILNLK